MQPIKTTNTMNPAPAKGIESFPTPVIEDVVISEVVNAWKGDYEKLEYGTLWNDVTHAPNQGSFPEHKLVYQQPTSEDGQWVKRIWVNDRANQDSYNYAIKYSAGSQDHPIYIRTYVFPRETYAPLPDGTPDPLFPSAVLVDEEANRVDGELDSKYISVTRAYETLPGPQVPTKRYNERGDLETIITQTVPPNTLPDPDGLLVIGSQVVQEEIGKGVKTTSTVDGYSELLSKERKNGLLGYTIVTDDVVDPSTPPDDLNYDAIGNIVISSEVKQVSKTKAVKRTIKAINPKSLYSTSLYPSPIGDVSAIITKSIVPAGTLPENSYTILKDTITPIDEFKSERERVEVVTDASGEWPKVYGIDIDLENGINLPYIETVIPVESIYDSSQKDFNKSVQGYASSSEYSTIDSYKIKQKSYSVENVLNEYIKVLGEEVKVSLPDQLLSIRGIFGLSNGEGEGKSEAAGSGTSYNYSISGSQTSSSAASGDVAYSIKRGYQGPVPGNKVIFFSKSNLSRDEVILRIKNKAINQGLSIPKLYSLREYPNIKEQTRTLVVYGGSKSKSESKSESASLSLNGNSNAISENTSYNVSVTANAVSIPQALNERIEIISSPRGSLGDLTVPYGISTTYLAATVPPKFPDGFFLMSVDTTPYRFGFFKYTCILADIDDKYINRSTME